GLALSHWVVPPSAGPSRVGPRGDRPDADSTRPATAGPSVAGPTRRRIPSRGDVLRAGPTSGKTWAEGPFSRPPPPGRPASREGIRYWLFKSEPSCYAFADLSAAPDRTTGWD